MIKGKKQMGLDELGQLKAYLMLKLSISDIVKLIGRDKTTLYRALEDEKINYQLEPQKFDPIKIFERKKTKQSLASKRYCRIEKGSEEEKYILHKIKLYWSPKQISGRYERETNTTLSHQTIYSYLYNNHKKLISKYFRRGGRKYRTCYKNLIIPNRTMIDERPGIINERQRVGDWEGDLIIGAQQGDKAVILTNVERKTGYLIATKVEDKTAFNIFLKTLEIFKKIPKKKKLSITYDNGSEFAMHENITRQTGMKVYFCHSYHSREKATNENTNGLIRQFLPKRTNFEKISEEKLQKIVKLINKRPRERLGFLSPSEVF